MLTNDNTLRAIAALERKDKDVFHGDLDEYLIEVLMSLKMQPTKSDLQMLHKEVHSVLSKLEGKEAKEATKDIANIFSDWEELV